MPSSSSRHPAYTSYRIQRYPQGPPQRHGIAPPSDDPGDLDLIIDKPILALNYKGKYLGGAYWRYNDSTLVLLGELQCVNPVDFIDLGISLLNNSDDSQIADFAFDNSPSVWNR